MKERRQRAPLPAGFGAIWVTVAVDLIGFGIVLPILPRYAQDLHVTPTVVGLLVGSFSLAQLICAPLLGRLSDRIGRKPVILVSLCGTAVGSVLTGLAGTVWLLLLGRLVDGASGASVSVAQAAAADLAEPNQRPRLFGLLGAAFGVGFVLGPAIGALAALGGPRVPFFVAAAIAGTNALLAVRRLPETHGPRRTIAMPATVPVDSAGVHAGGNSVASETASERPIVVDSLGAAGSPSVLSGQPPRGVRTAGLAVLPGQVWALIVVAFTALVAFSGFEGTFSLLVKDRFHLTLSGTGAVFTVIGVALVLVQAGLIHPLSARYDEGTILRGGLLFNGAGLVLLSVDASWFSLVPALLLLVLGQGLVSPTMSSAVAGRAAPSQRGRTLGYQQSAGSLARFVGPFLAGALYQHVAIGAPYFVGGVLVGLALFLVPTRPPATEEPPAHRSRVDPSVVVGAEGTGGAGISRRRLGRFARARVVTQR